jgi:lipoate-protein ligase A
MTTALVLDSGPGPAAFNMALDEVLLESAPSRGRMVLRFYGWTEPAASFGYFQHISEVEALTPLRPLIRRPTAGGIVPHDADWTYSLVFPANHPWYAFRAAESYRAAHSWIQAAFSQLGLATALAPSRFKAQAGQCFSGYEEADLLWRGRKIAGAAQRRTRDGLLIQGSVQPPRLGLARADWQRAMRAAAPFDPPVEWLELSLDPALRKRALDLAATKFGLAAYNRKR